MSKERLEEIKGRCYGGGYFTIVGHVEDRDGVEMLGKDVKWLIEQAERVESMEFYKEDWMFITEQNKRYQESIKLALNHIHAGNFTLATVELNKALLKEVEQ